MVCGVVIVADMGLVAENAFGSVLKEKEYRKRSDYMYEIEAGGRSQTNNMNCVLCQ